MGRIAVIGGGAAGMMAALSAARKGVSVTIFERNDRIGKKILATGNGRCNFSNRDFSVAYYYGNREKLKGCFSRFSMEDTVHLFETAGMLVKDRQGYLYPWSDQASTLLDIFRLELARHKVEICLDSKVEKIIRDKKTGKFRLEPCISIREYEAVILACGGCAAPKTGSDGSGFLLARDLGHRMVSPVPALVQLRCSDSFFKAIAGVRCEAGLTLCQESGKESMVLQEEWGELQLTDYGISGIPVFQMSRTAARALEQKKRVVVYIDFLPQMEEQDFQLYCVKKLQSFSPILTMTIEEFLTGIGNKKLNHLFIKLANLSPGQPVFQIKKKELKRLLYSYKRLKVHVAAANSFENAQVTAGGVDLEEVDENLESVKLPGLYFAGEMLDVDGRCGGYNLQWAWTSGWIAGEEAAGKAIRSGIAAFP